MQAAELPVAIVGAGPVGLAAAAHLVRRGIRPMIFERGEEVGASMSEWSHVRVFSPWRYNIDGAARALLARTGWQAPDPDALPTGGEIVSQYLKPLAGWPQIAAGLRLGATVTGITREGHDKMRSAERDISAFVIRYARRDGTDDRARARAVIDASGTWTQPNPIGVDGLSVPGERAAAKFIAYGIPDVVQNERGRYVGKRVLVIGAGHSAINVALALMELQQEDPQTQIFWALRHNGMERLLGGGLNDELPERGALGLAAKRAMEDGRLNMLAPFAVERVSPLRDGVHVSALLKGKLFEFEVDRIVVTTGSRPDLSFLSELRISLDPAVESPPALAPLIDPNFHSCGTVPPHGIDELAHPEPGFTIVGSKSYGRAPTFLMATGYEQVRSVVAEIAGDHVGARQVQLALPETGVCGAPRRSDPDSGIGGGCCGGPAPSDVEACCVLDAKAKEEGKAGCGCGTRPAKIRKMEAAE
jgi:Pyridine nucleotide-disulphide oxidoreductase